MTLTTTSGRLADARRIVVKIGSDLLTGPQGLDEDWLDSLAVDMMRLRARRQEVIAVSSGSIALGRTVLKLPAGTLRLEESQAAAAAGQIALARAWSKAFLTHDAPVAQVLLTLDDTEQRRRYLNARSTLAALLRLNALPVINENDTVATAEIRYGDNDRLAARVAGMVGADVLVLLSNVDGLFTADPRITSDASLVPEVTDMTPEIQAMAGERVHHSARGGMRSKLEAARIALGAGCHMVIANGRKEAPLQSVETGGPCTWFVAQDTPRAARKTWITGTLHARGNLTVDAGAVRALEEGASLLPVGVTAVAGEFDRGDAVILHGPDGRELGRGLVAYASRDATRIAGRRSDEIPAILGYGGRDEMIHRDDLVLGRESPLKSTL